MFFCEEIIGIQLAPFIVRTPIRQQRIIRAPTGLRTDREEQGRRNIRF